MRMHGNGPIGLLVKSDLRGLYTVLLVFIPCTSIARIWRIHPRTYGIHLGEMELEAVDLVLVKRIVVENLDINKPVASNTVVAFYQCDTRGHSILMNLGGTRASVESLMR